MASSDDITKRIGRYEVLDEIGRGGMAVVYRARDTSLGREVALKLLHPHLADHPEARKRFQREAHAVARLHHSCIVEVYDYSDVEGEDVYIVMELVEGTTLRKFLEEGTSGPLPAEAAALIARQVFFALAKAHEQGVVHRDVKPENILIGTDGKIRLSDFGIAHLAGLDQMTVTGQILGSPAYMSPEHIEMAELDARADIFSVGTMLYEMAVGSLPFQGNNPHQIIKRIVEGYYDHPLSVRPAVGHDISAVIVKCMQQKPDQRYQDAALAVEDLDRALEGMGVGPVDEELVAYFEDPVEWEDRKRSEIIDHTLSLGQAARRTGRLPVAMDHFNRVLALEPGNEKALDAVAGLSRRRRVCRGFERAAIALALLLAIGAIVWAVVKSVEFDQPRDDTDDGAATRGGEKTEKPVGPADEAPDAGTFAKRPVARENRADAGAEAGLRKAAKVILDRQAMVRVKPRRKVVFNPNPMRVEVEIDGKERFAYKTTDRARLLEVGKHTVRFIPEDGRLMPHAQAVEVEAGEGPMTVAARLKWRPARLKVSSNVDTVAVVQGRPPGKTNRYFELPMEGPQEVVKVLVGARGYRTATKQVRITAGDSVEVRVDLAEEGASAEP